MKKVTGGSGGGGYGSAPHVQVGQRLGNPARGKMPGHVAGYGQMHGDHVTDGHGGGGKVKGDWQIPKWGNAPHNAGQPLGNQIAEQTVCGPGGSRTVYGKSGMQGTHGAVNPGNAPSKSHDILSDFGPDYRGRGSR
jgi:hypothetical protein